MYVYILYMLKYIISVNVYTIYILKLSVHKSVTCT